MSLREGSMRFVLLIATASAAWGQSVSAGNWNLTGASGPASSSTMPSLVSISLTPANPSQYAGSAVGFSAMGTYSDGSIQDLTGSVTWNSSNATVASLSALGSPQNVNCLNPGTSTVTASVGALSGSTVLTCSATQVSLPDSSLLTWDTSMANSPQSTPSNICVGTLANPGAITCNTSYTAANYQSAFTNAACGQTIILASSVSFASVTLPHGPAVYCPANNWIIVTRDTTDPTFPAEDQRVDPCFMGIPHATMPYMPYPIWDTSPSCARHMPQFISVLNTGNPGPLAFTQTFPTTGTSISHWRFVGLEFTRGGAANTTMQFDNAFSLVQLQWQPTSDCAVDSNNNPTNAVACMNDQPDHIIFDRCVVHGDPIHQTSHGFAFGGARWVAVIDSYGYDFGTTYAGGTGDAQAISWGTGKGYTNVGWGKFVNNFFSASTEGEIFGGGFTEPVSPATGQDGNPQSVLFTQNHFYKIPLWDTQIGQTASETISIEGVDYPPANASELTVQPPFIQLQLGQQFQLNTTLLNTSASGINRLIGGGAGVTVDGVANGNSTTGIVTHTGEVGVGSSGWGSQNQVLYTYVACSGSGVPIAACTGATALGGHNVVFTYGSFTGSSVITATSGTPTKQIAISPAASDLQIQPSYSDAFLNNRLFCYTFFWTANYTPASIAWQIDGIAGGNATVGTIQTGLTGLASNEAAYCSGTATGSHVIKALAADSTFNSISINVSASAPILGFDLKPFTMKNALELKAGNKILIQYNLMEVAPAGNGNGGGQGGTVMLMQDINQSAQVFDGNGVNIGYGPQIISNITIDHNRFAYTGQGIVVTSLSHQGLGAHHIATTNNVFDDVNWLRWGHNWFPSVGFVTIKFVGDQNTTIKAGGSSPSYPAISDITFDHNTIVGIQQNTFDTASNNFQYTPINLTITNNIIASSGAGTFINAQGGSEAATDCMQATGTGSNNTEVKALVPCWNPYVFKNNALTDSTASPSVFISSPIWQPASTATDLFAAYNSGKDGDYRVCTGVGVPTASCTANTYGPGGARQAIDAKALGADIDGVNTAVTAVKTGTRTP
jgi:hypothetical protein